MRRSCHNGFTLVELLVVIVIIGIMAMMLGPTFTTGSDIARVKTAARGVMQMSRYARTMAVLHQIPVTLVVSADGTIRVERAVAVGSGSRQAAVDGGQAAGEGGMEGGAGKAYVMADLETEKSYAQVLFEVSLDDGGVDDRDIASRGLFEERESEKGVEAEDEFKVVKAARVIYESNGRCLPFRVVVKATGDDISTALTVVVDRFGVARVLEDVR